jgi:hypothetical protein
MTDRMYVITWINRLKMSNPGYREVTTLIIRLNKLSIPGYREVTTLIIRLNKLSNPG